jgi:chemotaxis protein MotA
MMRSQQQTRKRRAPLDLGAIFIAPLGIGLVVVAQRLAGVPADTLVQSSAALIVFGGTLGALLITYSLRDVLRTARAAAGTFRRAEADLDTLAATLVTLASRAHRHGLVAIDADAEAVEDAFMREGLAFAIDDTSTNTLREILSAESQARASAEESPARVLEAAAGYAPTLGILGAVLGLIHVMRGLGGQVSLGSGIAVAFVATVYGVGTANLILLPLAGRLRERAALAAQRRELMTVAICAIQQRSHPRVLARKLRAFGVNADKDLQRLRTSTTSVDVAHGALSFSLGTVGAASRDSQALA